MNDATKIITNTFYSCESQFGKTIIPSLSKGIYKWKLKVRSQEPYAFIIGIYSGDNPLSTFHDSPYGYRYNGFSGSKVSKASYKSYGILYGDGDIISIELNLINKTLKYYVNTQDQGIA